jgi:hypothetical protein
MHTAWSNHINTTASNPKKIYLVSSCKPLPRTLFNIHNLDVGQSEKKQAFAKWLHLLLQTHHMVNGNKNTKCMLKCSGNVPYINSHQVAELYEGSEYPRAPSVLKEYTTILTNEIIAMVDTLNEPDMDQHTATLSADIQGLDSRKCLIEINRYNNYITIIDEFIINTLDYPKNLTDTLMRVRRLLNTCTSKITNQLKWTNILRIMLKPLNLMAGYKITKNKKRRINKNKKRRINKNKKRRITKNKKRRITKNKKRRTIKTFKK